MAEEIGFENGRNSNFQGLVTLTLTLDPAIRHTVVHLSSTSTYIPTFIQIEETFCGRTDGHFPPLILLGRLLEVDLKYGGTYNDANIDKMAEKCRFTKNANLNLTVVICVTLANFQHLGGVHACLCTQCVGFQP